MLAIALVYHEKKNNNNKYKHFNNAYDIHKTIHKQNYENQSWLSVLCAGRNES